MQNVTRLGVAAMAFTLWAGSADAMGSGRFKGEARLTSPAAETIEVKVAGVTWTCQAGGCVGAGPAYSGLDDVMKECGKLSAAVGTLSGFKSRGRVVTGDRLETCNRLAGQTPDDQVATAR